MTKLNGYLPVVQSAENRNFVVRFAETSKIDSRKMISKKIEYKIKKQKKEIPSIEVSKIEKEDKEGDESEEMMGTFAALCTIEHK